MKLAVIDIGSNSVRLMIWADGKTLYKRVKTTRLGKGISCGNLAQESMSLSVNAILEFLIQARKEGAEHVYLFATAAVRSAKNGPQFCDMVKRVCGLEIDVISGKEEAMLGICGALGVEDGAIIDIGGASTEVCVRENGILTLDTSMNIGAVRLFDRCGDDFTLLSEEIARHIGDLPCLKGKKVYAIGGTACTLASLKLKLKEYDRLQIQDCILTENDVQSLTQKLAELSVAERKLLEGMDEPRADIIVGAAFFMQKLMRKMDISEILVSDSDNLEGYLSVRGMV